MVTATGLRQLGALAAVLGHWTQSLVLPLTVPDPDVPPAWPNSRPTRGQEWQTQSRTRSLASATGRGASSSPS